MPPDLFKTLYYCKTNFAVAAGICRNFHKQGIAILVYINPYMECVLAKQIFWLPMIQSS